MPSCSGLLSKRGTNIKTWHKRHFILEGVNLVYFTQDGSQQKGEYVINSDTTIEEAHLRRNSFCLIQHGRTLFMAADTLPEKEMWMRTLYDAIEEARILEISRRACFKKREHSKETFEIDDDLEDRGLERISEITCDTSFAMPSRGPVRPKTTREIVEVPKNKNPVFSSFESKQIHFHIMNARNLYSKGTSDTFARITVGTESKDTAIIRRDLNPSWDETFSFEWHYSLRYAKIEVWDVGSYGMGERFLGVVHVPIIPISSSTQVGRWCKLSKRSSKSHVSGEIYVDAYCDECYDFYPLQILNSVQDMHDLRGHVANASVLVPQEDDTPDRDIAAGAKQLAGQFMMQFPPLQTEHLEDICLSVTLKPSLERGTGSGTLFCDGILLLTNYRLIFVSNSRLLFDQNDFLEMDVDLTTAIPLSTVVTCVACAVQDPHDLAAKVFHDGVSITTNDARVFTFLFYEDVERDPDGNVRTNRHASADTMFAKGGEEKKTATLSNVGNEFRYLDANESAEGPPSKRFLATLERKGINRLCELHANINVHHALISTLKHDPGAKQRGEDYDEPELDATMLKWLKSIPRPLADSYRHCFSDGWHIYDAVEEFGRMNIPDAQWRITSTNSTYDLCDTYPSVLAVPASVNDVKIGLAALFRSRGRLPVLSWRHPQNFCSITRASQPLVGMQKRQSAEDEGLLIAINQAAKGPEVDGMTPPQARKNFRGTISSPFVVFDARPKINAAANQAAGKGYEMSFAYKNCNVLFLNIDNIHVMRKSLDALEEHCRTPVSEDPNWYSQIEGSGWLVHCNRVLLASVRLVHCICKEQLSVLVHCSDGWDRTAQLTSLAMLMMDPYYRTYIGFQILIEKEWLSFGHKFGDRLGWSDAGWSSSERSPVFMQFLDCVHQLLHQNPHIFEFNEDLLVFIMHQTQTAWFGNFLLNSEKDRKTLRLADRTVSIWSYVLMNFGCFGNPHYRPSSSDVWVPVTSIRKTVLWDKWFLKWHDVVWKSEWNRKNEDFSEMDASETPSDMAAHSEVSQCVECDRPFTLFLRRNHCFNCSNLFCERCVVSKPDVHGAVHLYCRNCFETYDDEINSQLCGISKNLLVSPSMTRRVLGSASKITMARRTSGKDEIDPLDEVAQQQQQQTKNRPQQKPPPLPTSASRRTGGEVGVIVTPEDEEVRLDTLQPLSKHAWQQLPPDQRASYEEDEETAQYVDARLRTASARGNLPGDKKPSMMQNLSAKFLPTSPKKLPEDAWTSGTNAAPGRSEKPSEKPPVPPSRPQVPPPLVPPKRFIPFSNEMMTKSSTSLGERRGSDGDPPPLAKKYTSKSRDNNGVSPARGPVQRVNTAGNEGVTRSSPSRSPKRQTSSAEQCFTSATVVSTSSNSNSSSSSQSHSQRNIQPSHSRSPPRRLGSSTDDVSARAPRRLSSKELLMSTADARPPSDKQVSILPAEDEAEKLRRKNSSSTRFDMYRKTSVDLSTAKNSMQTRKHSMEDSF